jgi:hypothetical protein
MSTQTIPEDAAHVRTAATNDLKLEVVPIPVSTPIAPSAFTRASGGGWTLISRTVTTGGSCR